MVINRKVGWSNLNLGGALTKSGVLAGKGAFCGIPSLSPVFFYWAVNGSISDAVHCNRSRSALHPSLQSTASFPASMCNRPRKYVRPSLQVRESLPPGFSTEPWKRRIDYKSQKQDTTKSPNIMSNSNKSAIFAFGLWTLSSICLR